MKLALIALFALVIFAGAIGIGDIAESIMEFFSIIVQALYVGLKWIVMSISEFIASLL